jgi:hypothetical protein
MCQYRDVFPAAESVSIEKTGRSKVFCSAEDSMVEITVLSITPVLELW